MSQSFGDGSGVFRRLLQDRTFKVLLLFDRHTESSYLFFGMPRKHSAPKRPARKRPVSKSPSYFESTLNKGEQIRHQATVHPCFVLSVLPVVLILEAIIFYALVVNPWMEGTSLTLRPFLVFGLIPLLAFIQPWLVARSTELAISNQRVMVKTGAVTQSTSELSIDRVESVEVEQGFMGRMLGYGTVLVRGTGGGCTPAPGIVNPLEFKKIVQESSNEVRANVS